jgi:hypothetical protein
VSKKYFYLPAILFIWAMLTTPACPAYADTPGPTDQQVDSAVAAIRAVWEAAQQYYNDEGRWPSEVDELATAGYLHAMNPEIRKVWDFSLRNLAPTSIHAHLIDPVGDGEGHSVQFDVCTGIFRRDINLPLHKSAELSHAQKSEQAKDTKSAMEKIAGGIQHYYMDKGVWPGTVDDLVLGYYLEIDPSIRSMWHFALVGSPVQAIVALSTSEMPGGAGYALEYDMATRTCRGYGIQP